MRIQTGSACAEVGNFVNLSARWRRCSERITFADATSGAANNVVVLACT